MTSVEFVEKLKSVLNEKTLYVYGCLGSPLTDTTKASFCARYPSNQKREDIIKSADSDTFGFDCSGLVKSVIWGWNGDKNSYLGGAKYCTNGLDDVNSLGLRNMCDGLSSDFSNIEIGEYLWIDGHCGVYIGDGKAIECTHRWSDGVQITEVWNISKTSSVGREWTYHGKLNIVDYNTDDSNNVVEVFVSSSYLNDEKISAIKTKLESENVKVRFFIERR